MLTAKENFLETIKKDGKPDRLVNQYDPLVVIPNPVGGYCRGHRVRGKSGVDRWGVTEIWPEDQPAAIPHVTPENKVCPDITRWRDYVKVPDIQAACGDHTLWADSIERIAQVDKNEQLTMCVMGTGVFEELHALMGFEDTLVNVLMEPEAMAELADAIGDYRATYARLLIEHLHPDVIISLDDWGSKDSLFMRPETWREIIKPQYEKMFGYIKSTGTILIHHSDSFLEPLLEDLVEMKVDVWQGALPTNDIVGLQKQVDGRIAIMGGIDSIIDRADSTEEEIRAEVRRACTEYGPGGHFIPSITYGPDPSIYPHVTPIVRDEINRYNKEHYGVS